MRVWLAIGRFWAHLIFASHYLIVEEGHNLRLLMIAQDLVLIILDRLGNFAALLRLAIKLLELLVHELHGILQFSHIHLLGARFVFFFFLLEKARMSLSQQRSLFGVTLNALPLRLGAIDGAPTLIGWIQRTQPVGAQRRPRIYSHETFHA